jgi:hypothetical protein
MSVQETTKVAKDAAGTPAPFNMAFQDKDGAGTSLAPIHAVRNSQGVTVDPATAQLQVSLLTALGSPFQAGGSIGNASFGAVQSGAWIVDVTSLPALPAGSNVIGGVTQSGGPWSVSWSGQSVAATQSGAWSVSISGAVTLGAGAATIGAVLQSGSTGLDYSSNRPALPAVGANFAASGPYASYVLTATAPASAARAAIDVENTSGAQIVILRDDGTAAAGAAPANASLFALGGGSAAGAQGGSWTSATFKGRVQVYAPASLSTSITFTGALTAATSGTLSAAWTGASGNFYITFSDGSVHLAALANGSTAVTWTGAVTGTAAASVATAQVAVFVD